ncbi:MAG: NADP-dependent oxidoreductase [Micrococcales bacterium]|nr:NADP-dependent oxidoreductase [Micrococcales bacterium]
MYVSGAAGGVGSCAVQFAKARGARVIGVAGSPAKVALLTDVLGADRAINRHDGAAVDLLRDAAPEGIDLYYDNVGGEQLEAALEVLNFGGRVVICGAVADGANSGAPANYRRLIYQELTMRGFTVTAHEDLRDQFESEVGGWLRSGRVRSLHTVFDGIDRVPEAFESLLTGGSCGRVIVSVRSP